MGRMKWAATYTRYLALGMQLPPALQSLFSFHLGCGYARKKEKKSNLSWKGSFEWDVILIAENVWGRKLSRISRFCGYTWKFSPQNLRRVVLWRGKSEQSAKFFSAKNVFFTISQKFSPSNVSRYTVATLPSYWEPSESCFGFYKTECFLMLICLFPMCFSSRMAHLKVNLTVSSTSSWCYS